MILTLLLVSVFHSMSWPLEWRANMKSRLVSFQANQQMAEGDRYLCITVG